jgi:hypothetical protein
VIGAICLVWLAVCVGLFAWLADAVRPEPADPAIVRARPERVTRTVAAAATECAIVLTVDDPLDDPATLRVALRSFGDTGEEDLGEVPLAPDGRLVTPCARITLTVSGPGRITGMSIQDATEAGTPAFVDLQVGIRVTGTVSDDAGEPVPDAEITSAGPGGSGRTTSEADGSFTVYVPPDATSIDAWATGYEYGAAPLTRTDVVVADQDVELVLVKEHRVLVYCAGLPDDRCGDLLVQCTDPWLFFGDACDSDGEDLVCTCPKGKSAVRGGGRSVTIDAQAEEAWLDFRDSGVIVGKVTVGGEPMEGARVATIRVPNGFEDLPNGLIAARQARTDAEGRFEITGVLEGDWELSLTAWTEEENHERVLTPRRVGRGQRVDVGTIEITGGGVIAGRVVDGLTGETVMRAPIMALRDADPGGRPTFVPDDGDHDGEFRLEGLPAGTWNVAVVTSPQESVTIHLAEGAAVENVVLRTSTATALDENGFTLGEGLVVDAVEADTPAWEAGLEVGDRVVGVRIAGFDVDDALGEHREMFTRMVLGHYDGPGVTLVVEGGEGEELVPLEW